MTRTVFTGTFSHRFASFAALMAIGTATTLRRLAKGPLVAGWTATTEIGVRFWRYQFNKAFAFEDMAEGRAYFDSLQTFPGPPYPVRRLPAGPDEPRGAWFVPDKITSDATILYLHGGGYAFNPFTAKLLAETLADATGAKVFAPDYRLTPEHPHPAQIDDSMDACHYLLDGGVDPAKWVIIGDSAGGHLTLMTLIALHKSSLPQPALAIGLCPWTDIGERGHSLHANDVYDLVQGWQAIRYGQWLIGTSGATREQLSPISQDFRGLAPLYLQGGGKEILIGMIRDFANAAKEQGCDIMLDVWPDMYHDFQMGGASMRQSAEALARIALAVATATNQSGPMSAGPQTEMVGGGRLFAAL